MNTTWRLLKTGQHDAAANMAIDEAILLGQESCPQPTLRFYDWSQPAFSLGYFQQVTTEIDAKRCATQGVELVRRITGGGTVVHGWDVTYAIIVPHGTGVMPSDISASYCWIANRLVHGFHQINIPAERHSRKPETANVGPNTCLTNPAEHDIMLNRKKIAGVSQRRNRIGVMYQGYIALEMPPPEILALTSQLPDFDEVMIGKSTAINTTQSPQKHREQIEDAVATGFEAVRGIRLIAADLSTDEVEAAESLAQSKYATAEWTFRR